MGLENGKLINLNCNPAERYFAFPRTIKREKGNYLVDDGW